MDRIPSRIVSILRREESRINHSTRLFTQPLGWVVGRLAKFPGVIETLVTEINGRYFATFSGDGGFPEPCCGGHRKSGTPFQCVRRQRRRVAEIYARVPFVGLFRLGDESWELVDNYLSYLPRHEQMRTAIQATKGEAA